MTWNYFCFPCFLLTFFTYGFPQPLEDVGGKVNDLSEETIFVSAGFGDRDDLSQYRESDAPIV